MEDYRFQDYSAMLQGGMSHDVLIMGNSGAKAHFNTYLIDSLLNVSSFCIGIGGYPFNAQLAKYHLYLEHNQKPEIIIQNIDSGTLWGVSDIRHRHQSEQFFPLVYDRGMRKELREVGYGFKELCIPLYRFWGYQMVIKQGLLEALHLKHHVSMPAHKGFRPEEGAWDGTNFNNMDPGPIDFDESARSLFEDYLAQCFADSIKVIIVYSPMYFEARNKMLGFDEFNSWLDSLSRQYGFPYLDYLDALPLSKDSCNFVNASHMNPSATSLFTLQLCHDLDSLFAHSPSE